MNVGLVAEGTSDCQVLEAVIGAIRGDVTCFRLHPEVSATHVQGGWRSLKAWCQELGPQLEVFRSAVPERYLDALILQLDCSMADKLGAARPCPPASDTADALEAGVLDWLGLRACPRWLLIATPAQCTEAWVVAALQPAWERLETIECEPAHSTENVLVSRHLLRKRGNEVKKPAGRYGPLAASVGSKLDSVRTQCIQLDRLAIGVAGL